MSRRPETPRQQRQKSRPARIRDASQANPKAEPKAPQTTLQPGFFCDAHTARIYELNGPWR